MGRRDHFIPLSILTLALAAAPATELALACSVSSPDFLTIEANPDDQEPPSAPVAELIEVDRGSEPERQGCGMSRSSCDGFASLTLSIHASDDITPTQGLGYDYVVHGKGPRYLGQPVIAPDGELWLRWSADDPDDDVRFSIELWAVDEAGHRSEQSTVVEVSSPGESGCRVTSPAQGAWLLALFALLELRNRRPLSRAQRS